MTRDMKAVAIIVVAIVLVVCSGAFLVTLAFEHDRKVSIEKCRKLGTDPDDMIYIKNQHYLCVTKDGRVVGRT